MYTFGYIKQATFAHLDLDEKEAQAQKLQEHFYIFANEAIQTICGTKPKYSYFKCEGVIEFTPIINLGNNEFIVATTEEINWETHGTIEPDFADETDTKLWYNNQNIYLLNEEITPPDNFIAYAEKKAFIIKDLSAFDPEVFLLGTEPEGATEAKGTATNSDFEYTGGNTVTLFAEGIFHIPYKGVWFRFKSGIADKEEIDMPIDILMTIPLYIASISLERSNQQDAAIKRAQFERLLSNCTATDFLELKDM